MKRRFDRLTKKRREELLSAYLDGELDAEVRERLEAQLDTDPALRAELEALRRTVTLVRDLPVQPIPRNFILSPKAVPRSPSPSVPVARRQPRWLAPFLTAATTLVGLFFIVTLAGNLFLGTSQFSSQAPMPGNKAPVDSVGDGTSDGADKWLEDDDGQVVEEPRYAVEQEQEAPSEIPEGEFATQADEVGVEPTAMPVVTSSGTEGELETPVGTAPGTPGEPTAASSPTPMALAGREEENVTTSEPSAIAPAAGGGDAVATEVSPVAEEPSRSPTETPSGDQKGLDEETLSPMPLEGPVLDPAPPPDVEQEHGQGGAESQPKDTGSDQVDRTMPLYQVIRVVLGVVAVALLGLTIWAWRARRQ
jgi:hypothetical protein